MKNLKLKKGFTLTELIIVIVIIGILAAVLIPSLSSYIKKAKKSAAEQDAMTIHSQFMSNVDNEAYDSISQLNFIVKVDGKYYVVIEQGGLKTDRTLEATAAKVSFLGEADAAISGSSIEEVCKKLEGKYIMLKKTTTYEYLFGFTGETITVPKGNVITSLTK